MIQIELQYTFQSESQDALKFMILNHKHYNSQILMALFGLLPLLRLLLFVVPIINQGLMICVENLLAQQYHKSHVHLNPHENNQETNSMKYTI